MLPQADPKSSGYSNLLQELLLALVGFSGDVFVDRSYRKEAGLARHNSAGEVPPPEPCLMALSPDLDWVDAPDKAVLSDLLRLGHHYRAIKAFVEAERVQQGAAHKQAPTPGTTPLPALAAAAAAAAAAGAALPAAAAAVGPQGSIYRRALASGLTELLCVYQAAVLRVQREVLGQPTPPVLSALNYQLHDFTVLLPQLHQLVYDVAQGGPGGSPQGGAQLLGLLHARARCGVPALQSCVQRLLWHCNQVLLKQMASWMVHGVLLDPYGEFFIRAAAPAAAASAVSATGQQAAAAGGVMPTGGAFDWETSFEVVPPALPPVVGPEVAEVVAFIGKAVLLLRSPPPGSDAAARGGELLTHKDSLEFALALRRLQERPVFDRVAFERTVETVRAKVSALLWQLVVVQSDLPSHLASIKAYFLLANGELYHTFLTEAARLMAAPPRPAVASADIAVPFANAALRSTALHDDLLPRFRLHWAHPPGDPQAPPLPPCAQLPRHADVPAFDPNWDGLWLQYDAPWPLGLLFSPQVMARYNALFQLLLRLKRVQLRLEGAWASLCNLQQGLLRVRHAVRGRGGRPRGDAAAAQPASQAALRQLLGELLQLRHHMAHLVTNLQIYIQVDVIESNYSQLEARVAAAQDFSEVERAHASYLHALMQQSFLTTSTVARTITRVFKHVQEVCLVVDSLPPAPGPGEGAPAVDAGAVASARERVRVISAGFRECMQAMLTVLHSTKLLDVNKAPYLRQLYLRLNFNDFLQRSLVTSATSAPAAAGPTGASGSVGPSGGAPMGWASAGAPLAGVGGGMYSAGVGVAGGATGAAGRPPVVPPGAGLGTAGAAGAGRPQSAAVAAILAAKQQQQQQQYPGGR